MVERINRAADEEPDFADSDYVPDEEARLTVEAYHNEQTYNDHLGSPSVVGAANYDRLEEEAANRGVKVTHIQDVAIELATAAGHDIHYGGQHYPAHQPHGSKEP